MPTLKQALFLALGGFGLLVRASILGNKTEPERTSADGLAVGQSETRLIERDGRKLVQISGLMEAPVQEVWKVINDTQDMGSFVPFFTQINDLGQDAQGRLLRISFRLLLIERHTEIRLTTDVKPGMRIQRWSRTGGFIPVNQGQWILVPTKDGHTFARYEIDFNFGLPLPSFIERTDLRDTLVFLPSVVSKRISEIHQKDPSYFKNAP